jgi:hypothetical protein
MTKDELVEDLLSRIERARDGDDGVPGIMAPDVGVKAIALAQLCPDSHIDLTIALTLGALHWARRERLAGRQADAEFQTAMWWYARVYPWHPELVPGELHPMLSGREPVPEGPEQWSDQGEQWLGGDPDSAGLDALNHAITFYQMAGSAVTPDDPRHADYAASLCRVLRARFELRGNRQDLTRAIAMGRMAVAEVSPADPNRPVHLSVLAHVLGEHYRLTGDEKDAADAIAALEQAITLSDADGANRFPVPRLAQCHVPVPARPGWPRSRRRLGYRPRQGGP